MTNAYKTEMGWVVSKFGSWIPGCYDSEESARLAASKSETFLQKLNTKINVGEKRQISKEDLCNENKTHHVPSI